MSAHRLRFSVLGPLQVTNGDGELRVGGAKERALLARLLVDAGTAVPVASLIDDVWGTPPANPGHSLQARISSLRRALGAQLIERTAAGYVLTVEHDAVDLHCFERDVHRAADLPADAAAGLLEGTLGAWRGEPVPELVDSTTGLAIVARFTHLRVGARESLADALAEIGRPTEAAAILHELLLEEPTREATALRLAKLFAADDRATDALAVLSTLREDLADRGLVASPAVEELERAVLRHEVDPLSVDRGTGLVGAPMPSAPLIGRERELDDVLSAIGSERRLVTLWGTGGVGKTRLALEVAARVAQAGCRVHWIDCDGFRTAERVVSEIARSFELPERSADLAQLATVLSTEQTLLVLDSVERVGGCCEGLTQLLGHVHGLRILVTSRVVMRSDAEYVIPIHPFATEPVSDGSVDAAAFLTERARALAGWQPNDKERANVQEIAARLDGLALALELTAAQLRLFGTSELLARMRRGADPGGPRTRSLRDVIVKDLECLDADAVELLTALSVCESPVRLDALGELAGGVDVVAGLSTLIDHALVRRTATADGGDAYTMLQVVREVVLDEAAEHVAPLRVRRMRWAHGLAQAAGAEALTARQSWWRERLNESRRDLDAAVDDMIGAGEIAMAQETALALWRWRWGNGDWKTIRGELEQLVPETATACALDARVLAALAIVEVDSGLLDAAEAHARQSVETAARSADPEAKARAATAFGKLLTLRGQPTEAIEQQLLAHEIFESLGRPADAAGMLIRATHAVELLGDLDRMRQLNEAAREGLAPAGPTWELASAHNNLGFEAVLRGDGATAVRQADAALALFDETGSRVFRWAALDTLAQGLCLIGRLDAAVAASTQAIEDAAAVGDIGVLPEMRILRAGLLLEAGRVDEATCELGAVLEAGYNDEIGDTVVEVAAILAALTGDVATAQLMARQLPSEALTPFDERRRALLRRLLPEPVAAESVEQVDAETLSLLMKDLVTTTCRPCDLVREGGLEPPRP